MRNPLKGWIPRMVPRLAACGSLLLNRRSMLYSAGWIESLRRGYPCRGNGEELPWMNYAMTGLLEQRLHPSHKVFEYGCGYSTPFYGRLVSHVTSVEHDPNWLRAVAQRVSENVRLIWCAADVNGQYCRVIQQQPESYDLVVVDGWDRIHCVKECRIRLSQQGVILLDDSDRSEYSEAFSHLESCGFRHLTLEGLKPTRSGAYCTTLFYRDGNCLGI